MRLYLRAISYFRRDLKLILLLMILNSFAMGMGLLMAWPMAVMVDSVLGQGGGHTDWLHRLFLWPLPQTTVGKISGLALIALGLKIGQDLLSLAQSALSNHINYNGLMRVRRDLFRKLQSLSLAYHRSVPQGDAIYRLSTDTFGCQNVLAAVMSAAVATVTLATMTVLLMSRSVTLTLMAFSIAPVLALANVVFGRRLKERSLECKELDMKFTTTVQRSIACIGLVQAFGREADEYGRFSDSIQNKIAAWWRLNRQQMLYNLIVGATYGVGGAVIFGYGGYLVFRDQTRAAAGGMTVGDLMVFTSYLGMLWGPLCTLTGFTANVQNGAAGAQRVFEVLDLDSQVKETPDAQPLPVRPRIVQLDNVRFGYGSKKVLDGVSASIEPGQVVAFVGSSGVGKSTLLNLLPRFYDPSGGAIRFDGIDARTVKINDLRRHVAIVLQESVVLPTTIAENIAYGRPTASIAEIREAAGWAGAAEFIEQLPDGYSTQIAEGGQNLSGGQRQRISIARALLTGSPVIVLDEPTSALDAHHERMVIESLRAMRGKRTIIVVSHRLSTVAECDQIFVLDRGVVAERGTHRELLERRGPYARMVAQQFGEGAAAPPLVLPWTSAELLPKAA